MSKPGSCVGQLSKIEMSGRAWVQEGWRAAFLDGPVSGRARCIWGNVTVGQEAGGLKGCRHCVAQGPREPANRSRTIRFSRLLFADFTSSCSFCCCRLRISVRAPLKSLFSTIEPWVTQPSL